MGGVVSAVHGYLPIPFARAKPLQRLQLQRQSTRGCSSVRRAGPRCGRPRRERERPRPDGRRRMSPFPAAEFDTCRAGFFWGLSHWGKPRSGASASSVGNSRTATAAVHALVGCAGALSTWGETTGGLQTDVFRLSPPCNSSPVVPFSEFGTGLFSGRTSFSCVHPRKPATPVGSRVGQRMMLVGVRLIGHGHRAIVDRGVDQRPQIIASISQIRR